MRYWKRLNPDGSINTVESNSYDADIEGAIEIDADEFNAYIASLPRPKPKPIKNIEAELDDLKERVKALEQKETKPL